MSYKTYAGPALLEGGYKIFFFSAALWAIISIIIWVGAYIGLTDTIQQLDMLTWHGHTLIYGYTGAIIAGFAFTAIPNWTGRLPIRGATLAIIATPWLIARAFETSLLFGSQHELYRAISEILFYLLFVGFAAREVILGKNWRNMKLIIFFSLFAITALTANLDRLDMIELPFSGWITGLSIIVLLISIVAGRIIPAFTGNWMKRQSVEPLPVTFNKFDILVIFSTLITLVSFIIGVNDNILGASAALTGMLHILRLARWKGEKTISSPIVLALHLAYAWLPVGFIILSLAAFGFGSFSEMAALHCWTVGGIGAMTLAVMTRATLGHAGLPLNDSPLLTSLYTSINLAAVSRLFAYLTESHYNEIVTLSGILWVIAFALFLIGFGPIHLRK